MTIVNLLLPPKSPSLLIAPKEYDPFYLDQLNSILRLYFNRIDTTFQSLVGTAGTGGGKFLLFPYGSFADSTDQTLAGANTPQVITLDTTNLSSGLELSGGSKITINTAPGIYNFTFTGQFTNTSAATEDSRVWMKLNGTNVVGSTTFVGVVAKHAAVNGHTIRSVSYMVSMTLKDYIQFWWEADSTAVSLESIVAAGGYPTTPSVSVSVAFVSALAE